MASNNCPQCGAPATTGATSCKYCGEPLAVPAAPVNVVPGNYQVMQNGQPVQAGYAVPQIVYQNNPIDPNWPMKSKVAAGILGIFLGGLGIHKFYMGKPGYGILYLFFCWTYLPVIAGLIEGIIYLTQSDYDFQVKNHVRIS